MTWQLPDTYHSAGHGRGTATLKFYEGRDILDTSPQTTQFTAYTPDQLLKTEIKPNGNTAAYTYYADQLPQHLIETTSAGAKVAEHSYGYNPDGAKTSDSEQLMSADPGRPTLTHTLGYSHDPRDRITKVTKDGATAETYTHDASDNVTSQTINGTTTTFQYDRDRLMTANSGAVSYNYDPLGRLDTTTAGTTTLEQNAYDGFDNITAHTQGGTTTSYTYDPLNRMTSQTVGSGTPTTYSYLGLSGELTGETNTTSGLNKAYAYTPGGQRLYQYTPGTTATSPGYYSYNDHNDVEAVTGSTAATGGATTATYGYTAYGQSDTAQFTGADKTNTQPGATTPYNAYRFNAMRWDSSSGQYDMGFRNYAPTLNSFLTRDMYNGALADMQLSTDPFTGNRYTFAASNPITNIELDGHSFPGGGGAAGCPYGTIGCLGGPPVTSGSGGGSSSQCSGFMPNCNNPCIKYANLCKPSGTQLNEGTQPVQRNPSIWNMLPGACGDELFRLSCPNLAAAGPIGGSSSGRVPRGSLLEGLLRAIAGILNATDTGPGEWGLSNEA